MGERARGAVLYGCALAVLVGGGTWWVLTAPRVDADPRVEQWTEAAVRLLPNEPAQQDAGTVPLGAGVEHEVLAQLETGEYQVSVVCVGGADSEVRISLAEAGFDSGQGLSCAGDTRGTSFFVSVADQLRMNVSVGNAGPVVFRYALARRQ